MLTATNSFYRFFGGGLGLGFGVLCIASVHNLRHAEQRRATQRHSGVKHNVPCGVICAATHVADVAVFSGDHGDGVWKARKKHQQAFGERRRLYTVAECRLYVLSRKGSEGLVKWIDVTRMEIEACLYGWWMTVCAGRIKGQRRARWNAGLNYLQYSKPTGVQCRRLLSGRSDEDELRLPDG